MDGNTNARYRTALLVTACLFAVWGLLSVFDVGNLPFNGYQTDGNNTVTRVTEGGPAERAGFQVGDYIRVNGGIPVEDAGALARRPRARIGEVRTFIVERDGENVSLDLTYTALSSTNKVLVYLGILLGFCFLIFGLIPYLKVPGKRSLLFALFGLSLGFAFFGGPNISSYVLRTLIGAVGTILVTLGFAALLHFTLAFPRRKAILDKPHSTRLIYGPAVFLSLFLIFRFVVQPPATSALNVITVLLVGLFILGYFGLSLAAFVHSFVRADAQERTDQGLVFVLSGLLVGFLPFLFVVLVGLVAPKVVIPGGNFFFLTLVLIPVSLALAILKSEKTRAYVST